MIPYALWCTSESNPWPILLQRLVNKTTWRVVVDNWLLNRLDYSRSQNWSAPPSTCVRLTERSLNVRWKPYPFWHSLARNPPICYLATGNNDWDRPRKYLENAADDHKHLLHLPLQAIYKNVQQSTNHYIPRDKNEMSTAAQSIEHHFSKDLGDASFSLSQTWVQLPRLDLQRAHPETNRAPHQAG